MMHSWHCVAHMLAVLLLLAGGINWLAVGAGQVDLVRSLLGKTGARPVYVLVGLAAVYLGLQRDFYLPFLGAMAFPCPAALHPHSPEDADVVAEADVPPGSAVVYWAAEPGGDPSQSPRRAYRDFANSGVAVAGTDGVARMPVRRPGSYTVWRGQLDPHVHFRVCGRAGWLSPVQTLWL